MASPWAILSTLDAPSSGVFSFTGLTLTGVRRLRIEIWEVTVTTDGTDLGIQWSTGGSFITSGYTFSVQAESSSASNNPDVGSGTTMGLLCGNDGNWDTGNASTKSVQSNVWISNPASTSIHKHASYRTAGVGPTGNCIFSSGSCYVANAGAIDGIKILGTSNLTNGFVRLWTLS